MVNLTAGDVILSENVSADKNATLQEVVELMNKNSEGVVVFVEDKKPVGIITERDILRLFNHGVGLSEKAYKHATKDIVTVRKSEPVLSCLGLMVSRKIRRLVVVDEKEEFLGVITQRRILNLEDVIFMLDLKIAHLVKEQNLVTVNINAPLKEALSLMEDRNIGAVPVVEKGVLKGIITESDILKLFREGVDPQGRVGNYMSHPVVTAHMDEPVSAVYKRMRENNIRRIVIVDSHGKPVAVLSYRDIAGSIAIDYIQSLEKKITAMKSLMDDIPEIVIEIHETSENSYVITWANKFAKEKLGEEIIGKDPTYLFPERSWHRLIARLKEEGKASERIIADDVVWSVAGIYVEVGKMGIAQLILKDITEEFKKAFIDVDTGVYNKKFLEEFLRKEFEWAKRSLKGISLLCLGMPTDTSQEDVVLVAKILTKNLRKYDVVAKGELASFYILLPDTSKKNALKVRQRLEDRIKDSGISNFKFSVVSYPDDFTDVEDFVKAVRRECSL